MVKIDGPFVVTITIELYAATTISAYFMDSLLGDDNNKYWKAVQWISLFVIAVTTVILGLSYSEIFPNYNMGIFFMLVFNVAYVMFL